MMMLMTMLSMMLTTIEICKDLSSLLLLLLTLMMRMMVMYNVQLLLFLLRLFDEHSMLTTMLTTK